MQQKAYQKMTLQGGSVEEVSKGEMMVGGGVTAGIAKGEMAERGR